MAALNTPGTRVLLLGTGTHSEASGLPPVPAVAATLTDLGQVFIERCGLPEERVRIVRDPATSTEMGLAIAEEAEGAEGVLWVHFVGHGLVSPAGELYLATTATDPRPSRLAPTALAYTAVRDCLLQTPARSIVVVLDCCFSGRAIGTLGSGRESEEVELARVHGGFVLAASAGNQLALALPGAAHTAFSGELIRLLIEGDPEGPPMLTLRYASRYLDRTLPSRGYPRPRRRASEWIDDLVLCPNPAYRPPSGTAACDTQAPPRGDDHPQDQAPSPCPYPGLAAFGPAQAQWFFGRDRLTAELVTRLAGRVDESQALVVVGVSGSGKSSLLGAGLLPALAKGKLPRPGSRTWPHLRMTPTEHPLSELAARLAVVGAGSARPLHGNLARDPRRITGIVRSLLEQRSGGAPIEGARLVIVVDQFEEMFTMCGDPRERRLFVEALTAAASGDDKTEPPALVVFGLRADFFGQCAAFSALRSALNSPVVVGPMTRDEVRETIERPALATGLSLQPGLLDVLSDDLGARDATDDESGRLHDPGALPLLAHALQAAWRLREGRVLTVAGYRQAGGIDGAVATTAEETYARLDPAQQQAVHSLMVRLVRVDSDGQDTRRRARWNRLVRDATDPDATGTALEALVQARLITLDAETVEITHEALLRAWPRLRRWIDTDRAGLHLRQQLSESAEAWDLAHREQALLLRGTRLAAAQDWAADPHHSDDLSPLEKEFLQAGIHLSRRSARRRRQLFSAMAILVVLALAAAGLAFKQRENAVADQRVAVSEALAAQYSSTYATHPRDAWLYAVEAYHLNPELLDARSDLISSQPGREIPGAHTITLSPDGRFLATGGTRLVPGDHTLKLWDVATGRLITTFVGQTRSVDQAAFSPDGRLIAATSADASAVTVWDVRSHRLLATIRAGVRSWQSLEAAFSPDGRFLAWGDDFSTHLWSVSSRGPALTVPGASSLEYIDGGDGSSFSPDHHLLAVPTTDDKSIILWDIARQQAVATLTGHTNQLKGVAFSPDGAILVTTSSDFTTRLWNVATHRLITVLRTCGPDRYDDPHAPHFVNAGHTLVISCGTSSTDFWDVANHRLVKTIEYNNGLSYLSENGDTIAISDDSQVAQGATDKALLTLWDTRTLRSTGSVTVPAYAGEIDGLALDDYHMVIADYSVPSEIFDLDPAHVLPAVCRRIGPVSRAHWNSLLPELPYHSTCP